MRERTNDVQDERERVWVVGVWRIGRARTLTVPISGVSDWPGDRRTAKALTALCDHAVGVGVSSIVFELNGYVWVTVGRGVEEEGEGVHWMRRVLAAAREGRKRRELELKSSMECEVTPS